MARMSLITSAVA